MDSKEMIILENHNRLYYTQHMNKDAHRKRIKVSMLILSGVLILVAISLGVWYLSSGNIAMVVKNPNQTVVLRTVVCNDSMISRYNDAVQSATIGDYDGRLKSVATDVMALPSYEKDSNCLFIVLNYYLHIGDVAKTRQYGDQLISQIDAGNYISGKLIDPVSITDINNGIKSLEDNTNSVDAG